MSERHFFVGVYKHHDRSRAAVVRLSCATDFAARTAEAQEFADKAARYACGFGCDTVAALLAVVGPEGHFSYEVGKLGKLLGERVEIESVTTVVAAQP